MLREQRTQKTPQGFFRLGSAPNHEEPYRFLVFHGILYHGWTIKGLEDHGCLRLSTGTSFE
jgi:hypothetical protein